MLRILLSIQSEGIECFPFSFQPRARWFSEAYINSPFLPRVRSGDPLGETHTHLDGVVGHFGFRKDTKLGLILTPDSTQFIATEAKMFAGLSKGVTNAKDYDQAARTVACIAWIIKQSNRFVENLTSIGFYVVAPQEQIAKGIFESKTKKSSIKEKVRLRVNSYVDDDKKYNELQKWYDDFFLPTLEQIDIRCISWESIINKIGDRSIQDFYNQCIRFNTKN